MPLPVVYHLRETLNAVPPEEDIPHDLLQKYDAPVLASGVKLWALELDPPLCMYEGWDEMRKLYPTGKTWLCGWWELIEYGLTCGVTVS